MELIDQFIALLPTILIGFFLLSIAKGVIRVIIKVGLCAVGLYVIWQILGQLPL